MTTNAVAKIGSLVGAKAPTSWARRGTTPQNRAGDWFALSLSKLISGRGAARANSCGRWFREQRPWHLARR